MIDDRCAELPVSKPIRVIVRHTAGGALIAAEIARWKPVIEQSRMRPD